MNNTVLAVVIVVALIVMWFAFRVSRPMREFAKVVAEICDVEGVPNVPFDAENAARQTSAGSRPGVPRNGEWWVASGIEVIGDSKLTRLIEETMLPNFGAVHQYIKDFFAPHAGPALAPPHLAEGRMVGSMTGLPGEVIYARTTGRMRPIGAIGGFGPTAPHRSRIPEVSSAMVRLSQIIRRNGGPHKSPRALPFPRSSHAATLVPRDSPHSAQRRAWPPLQGTRRIRGLAGVARSTARNPSRLRRHQSRVSPVNRQ